MKYQVNIKNEELQADNIVTLCDTMLWIYHNSEFQQIQINRDYLQIIIVDNEKEIVLPDWEHIIAHMIAKIELQLNNKAD